MSLNHQTKKKRFSFLLSDHNKESKVLKIECNVTSSASNRTEML